MRVSDRNSPVSRFSTVQFFIVGTVTDCLLLVVSLVKSNIRRNNELLKIYVRVFKNWLVVTAKRTVTTRMFHTFFESAGNLGCKVVEICRKFYRV